MPTTTPESPPTLDEAKLRDALQNPSLTLDAIAKDHNLTIDELLDWLERPETINRFQRMKHAERLRTSLITRQARRIGLEALQRAAVNESPETSRKAGDAILRATTRHPPRRARVHRDREAGAQHAPRQHTGQTATPTNPPTSSSPQPPPNSNGAPRSGASAPTFKHDYTPPVENLLSLSQPDPAAKTPDLWPDPASLGLTTADAPQLLRLARDRPLSYCRSDARFAPQHALRALARLNITSSARDLLELLDTTSHIPEDPVFADLPIVLAHFGPPILQELIYDITSKPRPMNAHEANATAITTILSNHPEEKTTALPQLKSLLKAQQNPAPHAASAAGEIRVHVLTKLINELEDPDPG